MIEDIDLGEIVAVIPTNQIVAVDVHVKSVGILLGPEIHVPQWNKEGWDKRKSSQEDEHSASTCQGITDNRSDGGK